MTPEQIQALIDQIFQIAGAAASKGFELAVRQVYAEIAVNGLWIVIGIALLIIGNKGLQGAKANADRQEMDLWDDENGGWLTLAICGFFIGTLAIIFPLFSILPRLINPQWYAVNILLAAVRGG